MFKKKKILCFWNLAHKSQDLFGFDLNLFQIPVFSEFPNFMKVQYFIVGIVIP